MRLRLIALSLSFGFLASGAAFASPINPDVTFYLYGGTTNGGGVASGSVTINTLTGAFVSEDLIFSKVFIPELGQTQNYTFSGPTTSQGPDGNSYGAELFASGNTAFYLDLPGTSLIGYGGGPLCMTTNLPLCSDYSVLYTGNAVDYFANETGGYLSAVPPTPEPPSFFLLGSGLAVIAARWRLRKN